MGFFLFFIVLYTKPGMTARIINRIDNLSQIGKQKIVGYFHYQREFQAFSSEIRFHIWPITSFCDRYAAFHLRFDFCMDRFAPRLVLGRNFACRSAAIGVHAVLLYVRQRMILWQLIICYCERRWENSFLQHFGATQITVCIWEKTLNT